VEKALHVLPLGLDATYIRALDEIDAQPSYIRTLALKTLMLVIYAERPLSSKEVKHALATDRLCNSTEDVELDTSEVILGACANLLEKHRNGWSSDFRPVHYSVQEFFRDSPKAILGGRCMGKIEDESHIHSQLATTCLSHLQYRVLKGPCQDFLELYERLRSHPFIWYAACSFDHHIMSCANLSDQLRQHISKFLAQEDWFLTTVMQLRAVRPWRDDPRAPNPKIDFNPYHSMASMSTMVYGTRLYNVPGLQDQWKPLTPPSFALHEACSAGSANAVARLLVDGHDVNERSSTGIAPLYHAASRGHLSIARMLLEKGADVDLQGGWYGSALQAASSTGYEAIVRLLLDYDPDVDIQDEYGRTALFAASRTGVMETVELLINHGADIHARNRESKTALMEASECGRKDIVELLLFKGADIHTRNIKKKTALHLAAKTGEYDTAELLISKGANIRARDINKETALHLAARTGDYDTVELLISKGANIRARDIKKRTALHLAAKTGEHNVVELLISKGADVHVRDVDNQTVLHLAARTGEYDTVELLISKGANIRSRNDNKETALHLAARMGKYNTVELLISKGANIRARNIKKATALHLAARTGEHNIVELLISKGADIHAQSKRGTVLQRASKATSNCKAHLGHKLVIELLLAKGAKCDDKPLGDESSHQQALPGGCNTDEAVEGTEPSNVEFDKADSPNRNTPA
jgi:ankyrin repeat protein